MNNILVSVLVPVYNTSAYLEKCLDTLTSQTLNDIEIICVNDGSTDNSLEILEEYAKKDPRVIIVNKENGGLPSARNAGIERAVGEYVGFVDSDDYVELTMFEKMYKAAKKNDSEVVVCGAEIFPTNPAPTPWLYDVLTPRNYHYPTFTPDIIFKERGARPFIWRNLIKRDLLIRENIRLREDIVLGEDQALQFKVYPKAKGVTFIADKLYHYCWYRPGSIMNAAINKKFSAKLEKHARLCLHVIDETQKLDNYADMQKEVLRWSVDLLFDDFIKVGYKTRYEIATAMTKKWNEFGYWAHHNTFEPYINDMFKYFYFITECPEPTEPDVSIIVNLYNCKEYFTEFKRSIINQTNKNLDIIFINNASDNDTYIHLHKWMTSDHRVRIVNQAYSTRAFTFNEGLFIADAKAVIFADAHDFLASDTAIADYYNALSSSSADIALSSAAIRDGKENMASYKLYDFMYNKEFLIKNDIEFEDMHTMTSRVFATDALIKAEKIAAVDAPSLFRYRDLWHRDWFYLEEANNTLRGYLKALKITAEAKMAKAHALLVDEINGDKTIQYILNATGPYLMSVSDCPNGENSQSETLKLIFEINAAIDPALIGCKSANALKLLSEFVNRRHSFLSNVMRF